MAIDLAGQRFTRLVVLERAGNDARRKARWRCKCDCGVETIVPGDVLRKGRTRSCGCLRRELQTTHGRGVGGKQSPTWRAWWDMIRRCGDPRHPAYGGYGDRGVTVCERWCASFDNFLADMGECPPGLTLDRRNNDGNYEPGNCRWATKREQANNRRNNTRVAFRGGFHTIADVARMTGINKNTLANRLRRGRPLFREGEHSSTN